MASKDRSFDWLNKCLEDDVDDDDDDDDVCQQLETKNPPLGCC